MTKAERLYVNLSRPSRPVVCDSRSSARVRLMGQHLVMMDGHGHQHALHAASTSPARLLAHWDGFRATVKERDDAAFAGSAR